jgi:hypothetical protein
MPQPFILSQKPVLRDAYYIAGCASKGNRNYQPHRIINFKDGQGLCDIGNANERAVYFEMLHC